MEAEAPVSNPARRHLWRAVACSFAVLLAGPSPVRAQAAPPADRTLPSLYERIEQAFVSGGADALLRLVSPEADRDVLARFVAAQMMDGATRATVRERDREPLPGPQDTQFRVLLDVFVEYGARGAVRTWRLDVSSITDEAGQVTWRIDGARQISGVEGLFRLALDPTRQFRVKDLRVTAEDLVLSFPEATAFVADTQEGRTALVILGRGTMKFTPPVESEQGQLRIFSGDPQLESRIESVFLRVNPFDVAERVTGSLIEEPVVPRLLRRAQSLFADHVVKSFGLDLSDLSRENWSLIPPAGDFLAEIETSRFGTLTYARSGNDPEDISLFDRKRRRNIAVYASERKLALRGGRAYSEDDEVEYDVEHYSITANFDPDRQWIDGRTELQLRVRSHAIGTVTLRLAEPLVVRSVVGAGLGRLLALRIKGQNSIIVNLPDTIPRGERLTLAVTYAGRLPGIRPEREVIALQQQEPVYRDEIVYVSEPRTVYTQRSYWYPQPEVTDYATGVLRLTVPADMTCVATGIPASGNPVRVEVPSSGDVRHRFVFTVEQPVRYFATVITRLQEVAKISVPAPATGGQDPAVDTSPPSEASGVDADGGARTLSLQVLANPRQGGRARVMLNQAREILSTYADVLGDFPYPTFTVAVVDDVLPGGHSPAYFALLHQPLPVSPFSWRSDPVSFDGFPQFFLAHEIAHQYWGNAIGWESYHEQWISEGLAQYFALLHAERTLSPGDVRDIRKKMRDTSLDNTEHGPVWLGYRLGHLQEDGRIFRAIVYNKSALVLHMLRRWLGDEVFFSGIRRIYRESRYTKIGTRHVRRIFEEESGLPLERFFERWIYGSTTPVLRVTTKVRNDPAPASSPGEAAATEAVGPSADGRRNPRGPAQTAVIRIEQRGDVFDVPVTLTIQYQSGTSEDRLVRLSEAVTEVEVPLSAPLRSVEVNRDEGALVEIAR